MVRNLHREVISEGPLVIVFSILKENGRTRNFILAVENVLGEVC